MMVSINLPSVAEQQLILLEKGVELGCQQLRKNLDAPRYHAEPGFDTALHNEKHLRTQEEGWEPPSSEVITAWFSQFKAVFPEYDSEKKLASLLGLGGNNAGRRVRAYETGEEKIPYGIWRRFLVITGRVSQEIIPVMGIFIDDY